MATSIITSWQIDREKAETVTDFILLGYKITADSDCSHEIKRRLLRVPWTARRSNQSILKEISPEFSLEGNETSFNWCWSWNFSTLATWCKELTHLKRPWCWQRLRAGEGDDWGWDGWMASLTQWTWVWVDSRSWWWTGRPGVLRFMGSQRVGHDQEETELNWASSACL